MFDVENFDKSQHLRERYDLGKTPQWMQGIGIKGENFSLSFKCIKIHKGKDADHDLMKDEWHALPAALQHPFAVTRYQGAEDRFRLYVNINHNGKPVAVGVDVKRVNQGKNNPQLDVNSIKTVFAHHGEIGGSEVLVAYDKGITPEQEALLRGLDFHEYPTIQELSAGKVNDNQPTLQGNGEKSSVQERNVETDAAIEEEISRKLEDDAELNALREKLGDVEDMWEKRIDDYLVEHYPNGYDGTRARTEEQQALHDAERKAAKEDAVLKKMREDAKAEFDAVDAELSAAYKRREEFYRKEAETKRETGNNEPRLQKVGGEAERFAESHGVDMSDVEAYENAMKQGNVQSAHWAMGNIRRTMRIKNYCCPVKLKRA